MRKRSKCLIFVLTTLVLVIVIGTIGLGAYADIDDNIICKGVYIDTIDVGNMTKEQAEAAVNDYITSLQDKKVTIKVGDQTVETTMEKLGCSAVANDYVEQALAVGKSGNLIKRYKELKDIENSNKVFNLKFTIDETKVQDILAECSAFDQEAKSATITKEGDSFSVTDSQTGIGTDVEATKKLLLEAVGEKWDKKDVVIDAVIIKLEPAITKEKALLCKDLLGSATTYYKGSSANRASNIKNGARLISGSVIAPGETFSAYQHFAPFNKANGWKEGGAYENGIVIQSIGGGVCQVSTTLYNALLQAEVEIVERSNHSMVVDYVKPAFDAAVAGGTTQAYKDLKFRNNTDVPMYVEGYTKGNSITFKVYGQETRPSNRTIKYVNDIVKVIKPGEDVITEDPTKDTEYKEITQSAHTGYKAYLYKLVFIDGKQVSKEEINFSSYRAAPAYIIVGTLPVETPTPSPAPTDNPGGNVTPTPPVKPTPTPSTPPTVKPTPPATGETTPPGDTGLGDSTIVPEDSLENSAPSTDVNGSHSGGQ